MTKDLAQELLDTFDIINQIFGTGFVNLLGGAEEGDYGVQLGGPSGVSGSVFADVLLDLEALDLDTTVDAEGEYLVVTAW